MVREPFPHRPHEIAMLIEAGQRPAAIELQGACGHQGGRTRSQFDDMRGTMLLNMIDDTGEKADIGLPAS